MIGPEFWIGAASSVFATALLVAGGAVYARTRTAAALNFRHIPFLIGAARRMAYAGVYDFSRDRTDLARFAKHKSVADFMVSAQREYVYVGLWLAHGFENADITSSVRILLERGCRVELVMLSEDAPREAREAMARYLGVSFDSLDARLRAVWSDARTFRASLQPVHKRRFLLLQHMETLPSSAQIIDHGEPGARALIDFKLFGLGRDKSVSLLICPGDDSGDFYERLTGSYLSIRTRATEA